MDIFGYWKINASPSWKEIDGKSARQLFGGVQSVWRCSVFWALVVLPTTSRRPAFGLGAFSTALQIFIGTLFVGALVGKCRANKDQNYIKNHLKNGGNYVRLVMWSSIAVDPSTNTEKKQTDKSLFIRKIGIPQLF